MTTVKREARATHTRRLIHVNPDTVYVKTRFRVMESLEFARPVSETDAGSASQNPWPDRVRTRDSLVDFWMEPIWTIVIKSSKPTSLYGTLLPG
jgi:hypothetical protein